MCECFLKLEIAIHRLFQPSNRFPRRVCNEHVLVQRAFRICVGHGGPDEHHSSWVHTLDQTKDIRKGQVDSSNVESWYLFKIRVIVFFVEVLFPHLSGEGC